MNISLVKLKLATFTEIPNFGGRSKFSVKNDGNNVELINSSGVSCVLTEELLLSVYSRYQSLSMSNRHQASQYVPAQWPSCPNIVFSPLVARLIAFIK
jgi:hypothetical protein